MNMTIGAFLLDRLRSIGVNRIYGVPGDFNLEFLELLESPDGINFIGTCNELNASYAADGDARLSGLSALITTYGVGDLAALPGIAGAYAEGVPVVMISGSPPLHAFESRALIHHTLADGNYDNVLNCFREFTAAQALITPQNAVDEIERVLRTVVREKQPVYLQLPSDICYSVIDVPQEFVIRSLPASNPVRLASAAEAIAERLTRASSPVLLLDGFVRQYNLQDNLSRFVETSMIPFATMSTGKGVLPESSRHFLGMYAGKASSPELFERIATSDCVLCLGVRFVDSTSGWFSHSLNRNALIDMGMFTASIAGEFFADVTVTELLDAVLAKLPANWSRPVESHAPADRGHSPCSEEWNQTAFWGRIEKFLEQDDVIVAENGTSLVALNRMRLPAGCDYVSQPVWGAIGYTLPAVLGTLLAAPERRHLLFIGDGSFQLTGQELSTILRHGLKPIIFLLNNAGYTIERMIYGERSSYNDVANWDYVKLPAVLNPRVKSSGMVVTDMKELEQALEFATEREGLSFIEVRFEPMDIPEGMEAFGKMTMRYDYGRWAGEEREREHANAPSDISGSMGNK